MALEFTLSVHAISRVITPNTLVQYLQDGCAFYGLSLSVKSLEGHCIDPAGLDCMSIDLSCASPPHKLDWVMRIPQYKH